MSSQCNEVRQNPTVQNYQRDMEVADLYVKWVNLTCVDQYVGQTTKPVFPNSERLIPTAWWNSSSISTNRHDFTQMGQS